MALDIDKKEVGPFVLSDDERRTLKAAWLQSEAEDFASEDEVWAAYQSFNPFS